MPKNSDDLSREGEPSQKTKKGLKIPIPKKGEFEGLLRKAAKRGDQEEPSQSDQERR
jgi:hypothetical protein